MFNKLLHGLAATAMRVKQLWTKDNVPSSVSMRHDFKDGEGRVPAAPYDACGVSNEVIKSESFPVNHDECGIWNDAIKVLAFPVHDVSCGMRNDVVATLGISINSASCGVRNDVVEIIQL